MDNIPSDACIYDVIAMNENVAKVDNPTSLADSRCRRWIEFREPVDRLTDDFELSLDGGAEHGIFSVILGRAPGSELANERCSLSGVFQEFPGFKPHREECGYG